MPDELQYQKKFGLISSPVNAIHMFALSQNHKTVLYNPTNVKVTDVILRNEIDKANRTSNQK